MDIIYYIPIALLLLYVSTQTTVIVYNQRKREREDEEAAVANLILDTDKLKKSIDNMRKEALQNTEYKNLFPDISAPIFTEVRPIRTDLDFAVADHIATIGYVLYSIMQTGEKAERTKCGPTYKSYFDIDYDIIPGHYHIKKSDIYYICGTASTILGFQAIPHNVKQHPGHISFYITYKFTRVGDN